MFHICFFLSVCRKTKHTAHMWPHKDVKAQREDHIATRLPRL